ncbi:MAG: hypothetical protein K2J32_07160, partial [Ruminococcus sp.]|nr:hypothetical protein [Ruminococcus sp.]
QRQLVNSYFRAKQLQHNDCSGIDQKTIIMAVKELYEKNYEVNYKIDKLNNEINRLNYELNKHNYKFTEIIKILCEKTIK